jgi:molecular chaperone GrpE
MAEENKKDNNVEELKTDDANLSIDELKKTLSETEKARDEYLAGWQRAKADFINYKNDERKHFDEAIKYGIEGMLRDIIGIVDNFDIMIKMLEKSEKLEKGVYLIKSQIEDLLEKRGVLKIPVKKGDKFDPTIMEAISEIESSESPGCVVDEIEAGYKLNDKILRASKVIVSKNKDL